MAQQGPNARLSASTKEQVIDLVDRMTEQTNIKLTHDQMISAALRFARGNLIQFRDESPSGFPSKKQIKEGSQVLVAMRAGKPFAGRSGEVEELFFFGEDQMAKVALLDPIDGRTTHIVAMPVDNLELDEEDDEDVLLVGTYAKNIWGSDFYSCKVIDVQEHTYTIEKEDGQTVEGVMHHHVVAIKPGWPITSAKVTAQMFSQPTGAEFDPDDPQDDAEPPHEVQAYEDGETIRGIVDATREAHQQ